MNFMKKNILITGAAGFIGFHLANSLHLRGNLVVGLDNFNDYYSPELKKQRAKKLIDSGIIVIHNDINNYSALEKIVGDYKITHIAHLAAQAGVRYSLQNPHTYIKENVQGFLNILELCRHHAPIKLTYASSSSVYGLNQKIPFSVEDRTDQQASLYGVTKKTDELMAQTYHHLFAIPVTGLRYFTVYGPWGRPDMAYFSFTKAILAGEPIDIYNHGNMKRDFTYIDDIIEGTIAAINYEGSCEIFNLGNHRPNEVMHFVKVLEDAIGIKAVKNMLPMQNGDVVSTFADIEYSREKLGFEPKTKLEEGIPRFVKWYKEYYT